VRESVDRFPTRRFERDSLTEFREYQAIAVDSWPLPVRQKHRALSARIALIHQRSKSCRGPADKSGLDSGGILHTFCRVRPDNDHANAKAATNNTRLMPRDVIGKPYSRSYIAPRSSIAPRGIPVRRCGCHCLRHRSQERYGQHSSWAADTRVSWIDGIVPDFR